MTPQIRNPFLSDGTQVQTNILISEMFYADTQKEFLHLFFVVKSTFFISFLPNEAKLYALETPQIIHSILLHQGFVVITYTLVENIRFIKAGLYFSKSSL